MFWCNHEYELLETHELPSAFEQLAAGDGTLWFGGIAWFRKAIVSVVRCKKCGRIAHVTTRNPE